VFDVLIGSRQHRERRAGRGIVSAALHLVVIAGAAKATTGAGSAKLPERRIFDLTVAFPEPLRSFRSAATTSPSDIVVAPVMEHSVEAPVEVPVGIPELILDERWSPRRVLVGTRQMNVPGVSIGSGAFNPDSILAESAADEPAAVRMQRAPRYPPALQAAGVEGRVSVRFVIDAQGRAEPASIRITSATHAGFEDSARETILGTVFRPARVGGLAVRQWAEQAVAFRIVP
jgi:TonB family protein